MQAPSFSHRLEHLTAGVGSHSLTVDGLNDHGEQYLWPPATDILDSIERFHNGCLSTHIVNDGGKDADIVEEVRAWPGG